MRRRPRDDAAPRRVQAAHDRRHPAARPRYSSRPAAAAGRTVRRRSASGLHADAGGDRQRRLRCLRRAAVQPANNRREGLAGAPRARRRLSPRRAQPARQTRVDGAAGEAATLTRGVLPPGRLGTPERPLIRNGPQGGRLCGGRSCHDSACWPWRRWPQPAARRAPGPPRRVPPRRTPPRAPPADRRRPASRRRRRPRRPPAAAARPARREGHHRRPEHELRTSCSSTRRGERLLRAHAHRAGSSSAFDSGGRMVASLATNQIHVGGGSPSVGLYNAIARGVDVKMVADRASSVPRLRSSSCARSWPTAAPSATTPTCAGGGSPSRRRARRQRSMRRARAREGRA